MPFSSWKGDENHWHRKPYGCFVSRQKNTGAIFDGGRVLFFCSVWVGDVIVCQVA